MTWNTQHSQLAPTPSLFLRTPGHSPPLMKHTKDASRPPEQKSFKPLIPNGSQACAVNAWVLLTAHPLKSSTTSAPM
ncbi:hypothetical protein ACHAW6_000666, partial [Cyclotella cf. meneghiniana]